MKKLIYALLFVCVNVLANPIDDNCPQFVLRGAPVSKLTQNTTKYLCKQNYAIHYRNDTKTAEYVVEHLTLPAVTGTIKRQDDFRPDPDIPNKINLYYQTMLETHMIEVIYHQQVTIHNQQLL